ncbi:MAG: phospholipase D family protein [Saccharospirillum sp.]|uniref:phospholipase D family protein n=1 Tax=Saccharospirillum sp. TaxID=2033801 RepID=UPI003299741C
MKFVSGNEYSELVTELVSISEHVDIAVAFLGAGAESLFQHTASGRLICNLESGATNPSVVKYLLTNSDIEIRSLASLHAKVILSRASVLCGSANISANGLGLENAEVARWYEAGIFSTEPSTVDATKSWFSEIWGKAHNIEDEDILAAEHRWKQRRFSRPTGTRSRPHTGLFAHILDRPDFALDRPLYIAAYTEFSSDEANEAFEVFKKDKGFSQTTNLDFYEGWTDLPNDAYLIDIYCGPRGGVSSKGLYWTGPEKIVKEFKSKDDEIEEIRIVFKHKIYDQMPVKRTELNNFVKSISPTIKSIMTKNDTERNESSICIPLSDIMNSKTE